MLNVVLLIAVTLPFIFYSCIVVVIIKGFYRLVLGRRFPILCGADAYLQVHAKSYFTSNDCITSTLFILKHKGSADVHKWRHIVNQNWFVGSKSEEQASLFSKFQCRIVKKFGFFIWENDPNFLIDNHIRLSADSYEDDDTLTNICSQILHQSMSQVRSPWEIVLVRKKRNGGNREEYSNQEDDSYATVWKIHHSLCDATLFFMLLSSISDQKCQQWYRRK